MKPIYHPRPERWPQFSLRAVLFGIVPYVALLAWIWSPWRDEQAPPHDFLAIGAVSYAVMRGVAQAVSEGLTIWLTVFWLAALLTVGLLKEWRTK